MLRVLLDRALEVRPNPREEEQIAVGDGARKQRSLRRCCRNLIGLCLWRIIFLFQLARNLCGGGFG